jgi:hypothetical protein
MNALGLVEIADCSAAMVALDAMGKSAKMTLLQVELNDLYGVSIKITGSSADVQVAMGGCEVNRRRYACRLRRTRHCRPQPCFETRYDAKPEFNVLIDQDVAHNPRTNDEMEQRMREQAPFGWTRT